MTSKGVYSYFQNCSPISILHKADFEFAQSARNSLRSNSLASLANSKILDLAKLRNLRNVLSAHVYIAWRHFLFKYIVDTTNNMREIPIVTLHIIGYELMLIGTSDMARLHDKWTITAVRRSSVFFARDPHKTPMRNATMPCIRLS